MTDVIIDFDCLYETLKKKYDLQFFLSCANRQENQCTLKYLQERRSYLCCAVDKLGRCVLHKCVLVIFGTTLDHYFRKNDIMKCDTSLNGTFMIDGRSLSFPNILMNNNILMHKFFDKQYERNCKRMFLYGNLDQEKGTNRAIQLVYDDKKGILFARDVYAKEYVVTQELNEKLNIYLRQSGKWEPLNFIFNYNKTQVNGLVEEIKNIMSTPISYAIDNLANKIIYKHVYLLKLAYKPVLKNYMNLLNEQQDNEPVSKRKKQQSVLFAKDCKKIVDAIVNGRLIYSVSKTFSKQKKNFTNYQDNSSNNNIEINPPVLKYRIGNEVVRITNDTMRQDMLMQQADFVKFVDSFFHGEMTVAGKKFFLCRNVRLPSIDYYLIANKFKLLEKGQLFKSDLCTTEQEILKVAFNNRPTIYWCEKKHLQLVFYHLKRSYCPIEIRLYNNILFVNHHEGMVCLRRKILINNIEITVFLTPFEYHNKDALLKTHPDIATIKENDDVTSLMSKLVQYYYKSYTYIYSITPVPKLIVCLTNLKNAMPVLTYNEFAAKDVFYDSLPTGNSVVVDSKIQMNDKVFWLWTLVRDYGLKTAEDPYIPDIKLPIRLYNNKINKLKGKLLYNKTQAPVVKFFKSETNNYIRCENGNMLYVVGVLVSNVKIGWIYDGKRYKIESCRNNTYYVSKIYVYFREILNQTVDRLQSNMTIHNDTVYLKIVMITSTNDLQGLKICGIHGQKGVMNGTDDLTEWMAEDGTSAQICLSPVSYVSRQSTFDGLEVKYVVRGGNHADVNATRYPIYRIPYMFFNNTPDNIFKEFLKSNHTGHEKTEGTRLDQWTSNQSFIGNRMTEALQFIRGGFNLPENSGEFQVFLSIFHCISTMIRL
ncbi:LEF-8 [Chrysodeixis includens nucleopolyhedrovirus]|uniref:DNA-directed RNA polymerase n=1 Tax=Chrysodeixis includens nucleopolyhedrovirus TaxID=1207438 RepID=A0A5B8YTU9_9ABAC|nr:LEF-8 [Chrysodeixis includens nucleopolyhedrovirus]QED40561.1 LEF-8 [Chrysodeixis includens nucleopolyhedrovirus]